MSLSLLTSRTTTVNFDDLSLNHKGTVRQYIYIIFIFGSAFIVLTLDIRGLPKAKMPAFLLTKRTREFRTFQSNIF